MTNFQAVRASISLSLHDLNPIVFKLHCTYTICTPNPKAIVKAKIISFVRFLHERIQLTTCIRDSSFPFIFCFGFFPASYSRFPFADDEAWVLMNDQLIYCVLINIINSSKCKISPEELSVSSSENFSHQQCEPKSIFRFLSAQWRRNARRDECV